MGTSPLNSGMAAARVIAMRIFLTCVSAVALLLGAEVTEVAGRFQGNWSSNASGASGAIELTIKPGPDADKTSQATFTLSGTEVKTRIRTLRVAGSEIEIAYEFGTESTQLVSRLKGKLAGEKLTGTYQTTIAGQDEKVDEGTFKATLMKKSVKLEIWALGL